MHAFGGGLIFGFFLGVGALHGRRRLLVAFEPLLKDFHGLLVRRELPRVLSDRGKQVLYGDPRRTLQGDPQPHVEEPGRILALFLLEGFALLLFPCAELRALL